MFKERRLDPRERLALPLRLVDGATAVTRDISGGGLYFFVEGTQVLEGRVDFEMQMPEFSLRFRSSGEIVRVEHEGGRTGVAVRFLDPHLDVLNEPSDSNRSGWPSVVHPINTTGAVARPSPRGSE